MTANAQEVLAYIEQHGPQVPNILRQALGVVDNFVMGALLSELVAQGKLALSNLSYGTSRFYYQPSKPESLEPLSVHLGEKDRRAFELLQKEQVLRHSDLTPLNKVAVSSIKDYSRVVRYPLTSGDEELFWRFYLLPEQDALSAIRARWFTEAPKEVPKEVVSPVKPAQEPVHSEPELPLEPAAQEPTVKDKSAVSTEDFSEKLRSFLSEKGIAVTEQFTATKNEYAAIVQVPSAVGPVAFFCKARAKKNTADGDLASAYLESQQKGYPLLYIAGGALAKKARATLSTLKGAVVLTPWEESN